MTNFRNHGTPSAYNKGCRCDECRRCNRERMSGVRAKLATKSFDEIPHGAQGYSNYSCRCDECRAANARKSNKYYREHREEIHASIRARKEEKFNSARSGS